ncbi:sigma factor-like helix-turn-helix DNA-binding protein [Sphingopyxis sp. LC363]|uniref:sigma factor-like helix-turn-helix DNA-binding protein n=1 Tax=Sphingopyxis sp. LC363 TaxID=1120705 RepID=UPI000510155C|nr:sigma factor-like helix-turn-helix DNA-binding protein [Sphingopyxis sp. LC363]KGB59028.1 ECF-type sigma factor [Sphingopyxis sp. LC363]
MSARKARAERLRLWRAERAVDRMRGLDRKVFLAIRVDEMRYPEIAERFGISVAEVEKHFAASLRIMMSAMDEKDPWWWRFRLW